MFKKETYIKRRAELKKLVGKGVILLLVTTVHPLISPTTHIILSVKILRSSIISASSVMGSWV